jgi:hypothetical protein
MALDNEARLGISSRNGQSAGDVRTLQDFYADEPVRKNVGAFLLGGVVVAGGLLAFLYYDTNNLNDTEGPLTTGSLERLELSQPASPPTSVRPQQQPGTNTPRQ